MLLGVDHFVIAVGDLAAAGLYAARFTGGPPGAALDPRLTHGARRSFG